MYRSNQYTICGLIYSRHGNHGHRTFSCMCQPALHGFGSARRRGQGCLPGWSPPRPGRNLAGCGGAGSPFPVISGSSAGAINAAVLASHADSLHEAAVRLERFWKSLRCSTIYRTDAWTILATGLRWMVSFSPIVSGLVSQPRSLLDNRPLYQFLSRELLFDRIQHCIDNGSLRGVAVTASGYTCASAISFYQAMAGIEPWARARRHGRPTRITVEHLMGSAALPLIFPAYRIGSEYFGDGGMRMVAPLSPAIHLGADRLLVITTRDERPDPEPSEIPDYPSIGEVGGYLLDTIFMDRLTADPGSP